MKRRALLASTALAAGGGLVHARSPRGRGVRRLTMLTDWPDGPGMLQSARRLAHSIGEASEGRIRIEVSAGGTVVQPFETFDAVQSGLADLFHSHIGYFEQKSPSFHFYSGLPFGLTAMELFAWVRFGGGQELWDELAGEFGIKPMLCSSTGTQMGGWHREEIHSSEQLQGLRYRMSEPGAEVFRRLGATVVTLPGSDIVLALQSGAIDACEWLGPWLDTVMGLHEAARYYYYPAWHEPGTALTLGINRAVWESLDAHDQKLIETAAAGEYAVSLAEFTANNAAALQRLRREGRVRIRRFDETMLKQFAEISRDIVAERGAHDALSRQIHRSYQEFLGVVRGWSAIGVGAYFGVRGPT